MVIIAYFSIKVLFSNSSHLKHILQHIWKKFWYLFKYLYISRSFSYVDTAVEASTIFIFHVMIYRLIDWKFVWSKFHTQQSLRLLRFFYKNKYIFENKNHFQLFLFCFFFYLRYTINIFKSLLLTYCAYFFILHTYFYDFKSI